MYYLRRISEDLGLINKIQEKEKVTKEKKFLMNKPVTVLKILNIKYSHQIYVS